MARSRKRLKRTSTKSNGGTTALAIISIVVCVILIFGALFGAQVMMAKSEINEETLCHIDADLDVAVVLLDLTDPLNAIQQSNLTGMLDREIARASTDTLFSLGVVSADPANWGAKFTKCKPETGAQANAVYQNPSQIADRYKVEFQQPLAVTLVDMLDADEEQQSPIMEALQALISDTPEFGNKRGQRRIIIVSDMLQHSETLSFYRGQGWEYFSTTGGVERLAGNLTDVSVTIVRIPRIGQNVPSREQSDEFWVRYFDRQGSEIPTVRSLGDL
ncbi:hypothetical protein OAD19_00065 [Octadecabacter sp.]|nr:hypothetical protein [Octadecabacter sp.]